MFSCEFWKYSLDNFFVENLPLTTFATFKLDINIKKQHKILQVTSLTLSTIIVLTYKFT